MRDQFLLSDGPKDIYCPIKVDRLINNIKQKEAKSKPSPDLSPLYVYKEVDKLLDICIHPQYQNEYNNIEKEYSDNLESTQNAKK